MSDSSLSRRDFVADSGQPALGAEYHKIAELSLVENTIERKVWRTGPHEGYVYGIAPNLHICDLRFEFTKDGSLNFSCFTSRNGGPDQCRISWYMLDSNNEAVFHFPIFDHTKYENAEVWSGDSTIHLTTIPNTPDSHADPPVRWGQKFPRSLFPLFAGITFRAYSPV